MTIVLVSFVLFVLFALYLKTRKPDFVSVYYMTMNKNRLAIIFFIAILIALSFLRESVFVNINLHLWYLYYHNDKSYLAPYLSFLSPLSYSQLYYFKWFLTVFFSLVFLFFSCIIIHYIFNEKKFIRWTIYAYLAVVAVSCISYCVGILFNHVENGYIFSRFFMGMVQSPFILILLIPAFKLADVSGEKKTK